MLLGGELFRALRHESQIVDYALFRRFIHPVVLVWSLALMILAETLLAQGNLLFLGHVFRALR